MKLFQRILSADCDTPVSLFARLRGAHNCFLFESAEGGEHWGRYSIIGFDPAQIAIEKENGLMIQHRDGSEQYFAAGDMLTWIRNTVIKQPKIEAHDLPFTGGAVGYFSYDIIHRFEPGVEQQNTNAQVVAAYMLVDRFVVVDNLKGIVHLCALEKDAHQAQQVLDTIEATLANHPTPAPFHPAAVTDAKLNIPPSSVSQTEYETMVETAKEYILAGDIFQVVVSQRFSQPLNVDPLNLYRAIRHINPSPYLFYMHIQDVTLIGSSPEILVRKEGNKAIVRPIAGTRPRGKTSQEDTMLEQELLADTKEIAEHVMLVDLGRNDLGRVSQFGSVKVTDSMAIERYSHVMHIVSQVEGELRDDVDALDLLAATFPAGTLSGAPKIRAMQIIDELEGQPRGAYGGCIGHISFGGENMDTAIIIRTAVIEDDMLHVQAGAGLVADSVPTNEYQECVNKASAMFRAVALASAQTSSAQSNGEKS
ncbi:anthranilate synthase component I [Ghiorsea bivora]|uniref:anthranilate synthase component I n=1 Tax=Ghiorsea bivora TaxID=1485545 RepID=UPI00056E40A6|nr:anthranilate synthase component I [Ghiorsea bivora]